MDLLRVLVENAGEVMTREDLITAVWGVEYGGDERLSRAISILRKALGDKRGQHLHIATISRVGYRLIADVNSDYLPQSLQQIPLDATLPSGKENHSALAHPPIVKATASETLADSKINKRVVSVAAMLIACLTVAALLFSGGRFEAPISLKAKMEKGFSNVENFAVNGAIGDAQNIFSDILADNPNHTAARAGLAFAVFREYTHLERDPAVLQRAKAHAQAALRADEHLALANIAAAWAAEFDGEFEQAHGYLDKADLLEENNALSLEARYRLFGRQRDFEAAEDVLDTALRTYPNSALLYSYRGNNFARKEDFSAAEKDFRQAIELSPDNPRTYAALAHILYSQNRTGEALEAIQQGLKISETALLYNNLGTYLFFQGQYDLAASAFEKTMELSGDTHDFLYWANLADAYRWSETKKEEARPSYQRALQLLQAHMAQNPNDANLKSRAAMFNAKLGDLDEAQRHMDSFEITANSPAILFYRAVVTHEILSNREKALEYLASALNANYPLIEILNDPELSLLRQDPEYHKLLAETKID